MLVNNDSFDPRVISIVSIAGSAKNDTAKFNSSTELACMTPNYDLGVRISVRQRLSLDRIHLS